MGSRQGVSRRERDAALSGGAHVSPAKKPNTGHSVFQRLLNHARAQGEDFNLLLFRYGVERLLYRLSISPYAEKFILKGASLFLVWKGQNYRVTKDADLLGLGPADADHLIGVFRELCRTASDDVDGIEFMPDTVRATPIREEQHYDGIRVTLEGLLHQARIPLQIDIGYGDRYARTRKDRVSDASGWAPTAASGLFPIFDNCRKVRGHGAPGNRKQPNERFLRYVAFEQAV
jgi:hypothetical protein